MLAMKFIAVSCLCVCGGGGGALDHASCAPQLMSCNYYVCDVCVYVHVCVFLNN